MSLKIPIRSTNVSDWTRKAADAVNQGISKTAGLESRATALETYAHTSFTLTPAALPGSPVKGMTVYDMADDKVKTWTGAAWVAHY